MDRRGSNTREAMSLSQCGRQSKKKNLWQWASMNFKVICVLHISLLVSVSLSGSFLIAEQTSVICLFNDLRWGRCTPSFKHLCGCFSSKHQQQVSIFLHIEIHKHKVRSELSRPKIVECHTEDRSGFLWVMHQVLVMLDVFFILQNTQVWVTKDWCRVFHRLQEASRKRIQKPP